MPIAISVRPTIGLVGDVRHPGSDRRFFRSIDTSIVRPLGMLLMLRDKVTGAGKDVVGNVRGNVKQVLDIANFGKLFRIAQRKSPRPSITLLGGAKPGFPGSQAAVRKESGFSLSRETVYA